MSAPSATGIAAEGSANLFRWNAMLAALHFIQAAVILALSFASFSSSVMSCRRRRGGSRPERD